MSEIGLFKTKTRYKGGQCDPRAGSPPTRWDFSPPDEFTVWARDDVWGCLACRPPTIVDGGVQAGVGDRVV